MQVLVLEVYAYGFAPETRIYSSARILPQFKPIIDHPNQNVGLGSFPEASTGVEISLQFDSKRTEFTPRLNDFA